MKVIPPFISTFYSQISGAGTDVTRPSTNPTPFLLHPHPPYMTNPSPSGGTLVLVTWEGL